MANLEERVQALEQEHTTLKKTIELQTIAIGALVNKASLEKLNEKYDKLFKTLIDHDRFTNEQLAELRNQQTELDGKIVGLQTEVRQHFTEQDGKIVGLQTEVRQHFTEQDGKIVGLQTEVRQRFTEQESKMTDLQTEVRQRFTEQESKMTDLQTEVRQRFTEQESKMTDLQTTQTGQTALLQQILARLSEKP